MHNLKTVFRFEIVRTLKKKSFWITALSFPVVIAAVIAIIFFSNKATTEAASNTKDQQFSLAITDQSNLISDTAIKAMHASRTSDKAASIAKVKNGTLDAYFYYPANVTSSKVEVYAKDVGLFDNGRYAAVAKALLEQSAISSTTPQVVAILQSKTLFNSVMYKDSQVYDGFKELIAPGVFLVLFYILIAVFGNQMLTSTTEEKENRVIEMLLTTIKAKTLIIGKMLSLSVLALIQMLIILIPVIVVYVFFRNELSLPNVDFATIPLNPLRIATGAVLFIFSFMLFMGLLVGIGAASPTAKEASGFFGVVMVLLFAPLYAVSLFVSAPGSGLVTFLSFFPLTAPIPLMLRNAIGNLSPLDAIIGIAILGVSAVVVLTVAVRLFRYGALEYSKRLSLKTIFSKN